MNKTGVIEQISEIEYNVKSKKIGYGDRKQYDSSFNALIYKSGEETINDDHK